MNARAVVPEFEIPPAGNQRIQLSASRSPLPAPRFRPKLVAALRVRAIPVGMRKR